MLRAGTLDLARELERRAERMDDILLRSAPAFLDLSSLPGLPPGPVSAPTSSDAASTTSSSTGLVTLTPEQQGRLEPLLRQALCRCDQIADIAANSANCEPVSADMYDLIPTGYWASPGRHDNGGVPGGSGDGNGGGRDADAVDPFANPAIRPEQIEYIRALSPADVTALFYLVSVLSAAFARARGFHLDDHPDAVSRKFPFCLVSCRVFAGCWGLGCAGLTPIPLLRHCLLVCIISLAMQLSLVHNAPAPFFLREESVFQPPAPQFFHALKRPQC